MTNIPADTPTRAKKTHTAKYRSSYVTESRATLTSDNPKVQEVKLLSLEDSVLPYVPPELLEKAYNKLVSDNVVKHPMRKPRWCYVPKNPSTVRGDETRVFKFVEEIFDSVAALSEVEIGMNCLVDGNSAPKSFRSSNSRPDAFLYLGNPQCQARDVMWSNTFMPMEFKKSYNVESKLDDFNKVIWSMHHIMRSDACRRSVLGLTCEDTKARLWYSDRCDLVASEEFDINKVCRHVVRLAHQATKI
ncbi:unnamed protein product [Rhizoctonia solani]|uniref:Fungal-type protein kinase domain-containing protein n=1 Tax=Rhizoctonia solani TaxID=456999 RepID=A0A8H3DTM3_9AGAM|nr:unnamed protein product [Rhizoctonia solani]